MPDDLRPPYRIAFDNARDPYAARNALGIMGTGGGFITSVTAPLSVTGGILTIDLSGYQPIDADLTAIAALTGTNTIYYRSAANTWSPVNVSTGLAFSGGNLTATGGGGNVSNSGTPVAGQVAEWTDATHIAGVSTYAKLASPVFTGDPQAPTPATADNDTSIATTAFVKAAIANASATKPSFFGKMTADYSSWPAATWIVGLFRAADFNVGGYFNTGNGRWTPPAGIVSLTLNGYFVNLAVNAYGYLAIYKNGASLRMVQMNTGAGQTEMIGNLTGLDSANGTDYYEGYFFVTAVGAGGATLKSLSNTTFFCGNVV